MSWKTTLTAWLLALSCALLVAGKQLPQAAPKAKAPAPSKEKPKPMPAIRVKTFKIDWKDYNAVAKTNAAPVVIFFVEEGTERAFNLDLPDIGGAKGFTYVRVPLAPKDLAEAKTLREGWEEGRDLLTHWEKTTRTKAEIAARFNVRALPEAVICDRYLNPIARENALELLPDLPHMKDDVDAAVKELAENVAKEIERVEKSFEADKVKGRFGVTTIRKLIGLADYNNLGRQAREMLKEIDETVEEQLADAVSKEDQKKIHDLAMHYKGLPAALKAREAEGSNR